MKVAVLGYGQLGRAIATALADGDHDLNVWTRAEVETSERVPRADFLAGHELARAVADAEIVFLAVADGVLPRLVERLAGLKLSWTGKAVLHPAGAAPAGVLEPLARLGAGVALCHPLRAFPHLEGESQSKAHRPVEARAPGGPAAGRFSGALFTIEGEERGVAAARRLVRELGGIPLRARIADRAAYHLAATLASNYGLIVRDWSTRRFEAAGLSTADAARAADALMRNALDNALAARGQLPLTGPIRRGDVGTVEAHLATLSGPELLAYAALGLLALGAGRQRRPEAAEGMSRVLEAALERGLAELTPTAAGASGGR